ncbi:MAG: DNA polymerase III, partial [Clostridia bacterium]|nr:DNA polymerase III [Clostridia bacterium]
MNYIVYDTEFNQPQPKLYNPNSRFRPNQLCPFEIIEIGAAKVSENLEITDSFSRLVKPVIYRRL